MSQHTNAFTHAPFVATQPRQQDALRTHTRPFGEHGNATSVPLLLYYCFDTAVKSRHARFTLGRALRALWASSTVISGTSSGSRLGRSGLPSLFSLLSGTSFPVGSSVGTGGGVATSVSAIATDLLCSDDNCCGGGVRDRKWGVCE